MALFLFIRYLGKWGSCRCYLAKLKKRKMLVPERKEYFHYDLAELVTEETTEMKREDDGAFLEVVLSIVPLLNFYAWRNYLISEYTAEKGLITFAVPVLIFWAFIVFKMVLSCSKRKYKEETNPDPTRKPRVSFFPFLAFIIVLALVSAFWMYFIQVTVSYLESSYRAKDESFFSDMYLTAISALPDANNESLGEFSIVFEKDGYRVEGPSKDQADGTIEKFMDDFLNLMDGKADSLTVIRDNLSSSVYGTLESLEIIVDGRTGSIKLVAIPQKKGWKPLVIPYEEKE